MKRRRWSAVQHVEVLDRLVDLPVFSVAEPIAVHALEQHPHKGVEEVQVLRCRFEREWIDPNVALPETELEIAAFEQRRELSIAVAKVEDDGQRVVLLRVHHQEVQQEALAAAGGAEHEGVADVLHVQIEVIRCLVARLEDGERLGVQMGAARLAAIEREQKAQIRVVRFEERQPPEVVGAVARHDAQPGVEQVVRLLDERAVVRGHHLDGFGRRSLQSFGSPGRRGPAVSEHSPKKWPFTSISVIASPSCRTVALALSSTSISSGRVSGET